jgi:hypothetical protein
VLDAPVARGGDRLTGGHLMHCQAKLPDRPKEVSSEATGMLSGTRMVIVECFIGLPPSDPA